MILLDDWSDVRSRDGHTPGAWDCPCGPWVRTDVPDDPQAPITRSVRHVEIGENP